MMTRHLSRMLCAGWLVTLVGVAPRAASAQATRAASSPSASVFVHVVSDRPVDMLVEEPDPASDVPRWTAICSAPCDLQVPADATYRIDGAGVRTTEPFRILGYNGPRVVLTVDPSSTSGFVGGSALAAVGFLSAGLGAVWTLAALVIPDPGGGTSDKTALVIGFSCLVGGATAAVIGVAVRRANKRSSLKQSGATEVRRTEPASPETERPRLPAWPEVGASSVVPPVGAREVVVPLWTAAF